MCHLRKQPSGTVPNPRPGASLVGEPQKGTSRSPWKLVCISGQCSHGHSHTKFFPCLPDCPRPSSGTPPFLSHMLPGGHTLGAVEEGAVEFPALPGIAVDETQPRKQPAQSAHVSTRQQPCSRALLSVKAQPGQSSP